MRMKFGREYVWSKRWRIIGFMAVSTATLVAHHPELRNLNILRDLPAVADLVETCFERTLDTDGHRYINQMRRASKDNSFLRWAVHAADTVSMPLSGFVWEQDHRIIGNVSLIPFRKDGKRIYLIANVAVHPDHRRRGIGRLLTQAAIRHASSRRADGTWLHVRDDNPGAIRLYEQLGFEERARRTSWSVTPEWVEQDRHPDVRIGGRMRRDWMQQKAWLEEVNPGKLAWYQPTPWMLVRPGIGPALYRLFVEYETRQWAAYRGDQMRATVTWQAMPSRRDRLWLAAAEDAGEALTSLLLHVRHSLAGRQNLLMEYPAGRSTGAITTAGFQAHRTLVWMQWVASKNADHA